MSLLVDFEIIIFPRTEHSLAVGEVRLVSCGHPPALGRGDACPTWGSCGIFLSRGHASFVPIILIWTIFCKTSFPCLWSLTRWTLWSRSVTVFLQNFVSHKHRQRQKYTNTKLNIKTQIFQDYNVNQIGKKKTSWIFQILHTLATQVGQNQSPSGTCMTFGLRQNMWHPRSQPSHKSRYSSSSPLRHTWHVCGHIWTSVCRKHIQPGLHNPIEG